MRPADPQARRDNGVPYDLLSVAGVGPGSSMEEIRDASYLLMEQGQWSPEVRAAWDELRMVERRLAVDFLLIDTDVATEAASAREAILAALRRQASTDPAELYDVEQELREITLGSLDAASTAAFDQPAPLPGAGIVEFDQ